MVSNTGKTPAYRGMVAITIYVDDLIFGVDNEEEVKHVQNLLKSDRGIVIIIIYVHDLIVGVNTMKRKLST